VMVSPTVASNSVCGTLVVNPCSSRKNSPRAAKLTFSFSRWMA